MNSNHPFSYLYPAPPPTLNNLDRHQRTRLIHSTRKLGEVLGTTPFLLEPAELEPPVHDLRLLPIGPRSNTTKASKEVKAHRRQISVVSPSGRGSPLPLSHYHNYNSSTSSLSSSLSSASASQLLSRDNILVPPSRSFAEHVRQRKPARRTPAPKALVLQMSAVPVAPSDHRALGPLTPMHANSPRLNTPASAYMSVTTPNTPALEKERQREKEKEKSTRRRRMTKINRQLGENVPPELVFPAARPVLVPIPTLPSMPSTVSHANKKANRRRSMTIDQPPSYTSSLSSCTGHNAELPPQHYQHRAMMEQAPAHYVTTVRREGKREDEWSYTDYQAVMRKLRGLKVGK